MTKAIGVLEPPVDTKVQPLHVSALGCSECRPLTLMCFKNCSCRKLELSFVPETTEGKSIGLHHTDLEGQASRGHRSLTPSDWSYLFPESSASLISTLRSSPLLI